MKVSSENRIFLKTLLVLAPPVIGQELLSALVNILSSIMIGRAMGINEITAVGISSQIFLSFNLALFGITSGCAVFIGQYYGKGDKENIHKIMGIGYVSSILLTLAVVVVAFFFPHWLMGLFSQDPVVIELGAQFIRVASISYFLVAIISTNNSAMRSVGQTRVPMLTASAALLVSFALNYIFIFILGAPLAIIATGTIIARIVELFLQRYFSKKYDLPTRAKFKKYFNFDFPYVKKFYKITIFILLLMVIRAAAVAFYTMAYGLVGTYAQGAVQISSAMLQVFQIFGGGVAVAAGIIIATTLGKGERDLATRYARKCLFFAFTVSAVMGILLVISSPFIVSFYDVAENVEFYVYRIIYVMAFCMILRTLSFTMLGGILRSGGDTKFCFWIVVIAVGISVPVTFAGATIWNLPIYWVVALSFTEDVIKVSAGLTRTFSNKWANTLV